MGDPRWPIGCIKPNSCSRHRTCMYSCKPHKDREISGEVDQAAADEAAISPPATESITVECVECVSYESGFEQPSDPTWRIEINGYCADFATETAAHNFARQIGSLRSPPATDASVQALATVLRPFANVSVRDADGSVWLAVASGGDMLARIDKQNFVDAQEVLAAYDSRSPPTPAEDAVLEAYNMAIKAAAEEGDRYSHTCFLAGQREASISAGIAARLPPATDDSKKDAEIARLKIEIETYQAECEAHVVHGKGEDHVAVMIYYDLRRELGIVGPQYEHVSLFDTVVDLHRKVEAMNATDDSALDGALFRFWIAMRTGEHKDPDRLTNLIGCCRNLTQYRTALIALAKRKGIDLG
jgi:hypothetical protein